MPSPAPRRRSTRRARVATTSPCSFSAPRWQPPSTGSSRRAALFTLIRDGQIEFDGSIIETALPDVHSGQSATIRLGGFGTRTGTVRLLSPSVDPKTRLGSVRIAIDADQGLPVGIFASAVITVAERDVVAVPVSAILPTATGDTAQRVGTGGAIEVVGVRTGSGDGTLIEIADVLADGDTVVAKAGPFFRNGIVIRPVLVQNAPAGTAPPAASDPAAAAVASGAAPAGPDEAALR